MYLKVFSSPSSISLLFYTIKDDQKAYFSIGISQLLRICNPKNVLLRGDFCTYGHA